MWSPGYHRLWAHRSYTASLPLKIWLAAVGGGAMEHSIINWSRDHRAHHHYTDTAKDPYSVQTGLFHAHIGWLIFRRDSKCQGDADISDLMNEPIVVWQHDHYTVIAMSMAYILPCCIGGLWGDCWGGFIYAGIIRAFLVQQSTFCVNSIAHWLGDHTFDDRNSPRDHVFTALITLGEGYHNFHHEFPSDYRNAIAWYQYDPTKWMIWLWKQVGLAHNLKVFRRNEIEKGRLQQQQKKLDLTLAELRSTKLQLLPVMEWNEYQDEVLKGRSWLTIAGVVYDVGRFVEEHPGGKSMIYSGIGKDATAMFNGGVYNRKLSPLTARSGSPLTSPQTQMLPIIFSPLCTLALSVAVVRLRS
jgi:stearoyl-CoA desaturase (delta-9 desaturase)